MKRLHGIFRNEVFTEVIHVGVYTYTYMYIVSWEPLVKEPSQIRTPLP